VVLPRRRINFLRGRKMTDATKRGIKGEENRRGMWVVAHV